MEAVKGRLDLNPQITIDATGRHDHSSDIFHPSPVQPFLMRIRAEGLMIDKAPIS